MANPYIFSNAKGYTDKYIKSWWAKCKDAPYNPHHNSPLELGRDNYMVDVLKNTELYFNKEGILSVKISFTDSKNPIDVMRILLILFS